MFDTIEYKGVEYPVRDVYVKASKQTENIAGESLMAALCPDGEWDNVGEDEEYIDGKVYFYAPDDVLLGDLKTLKKFVDDNE